MFSRSVGLMVVEKHCAQADFNLNTATVLPDEGLSANLTGERKTEAHNLLRDGPRGKDRGRRTRGMPAGKAPDGQIGRRTAGSVDGHARGEGQPDQQGRRGNG